MGLLALFVSVLVRGFLRQLRVFVDAHLDHFGVTSSIADGRTIRGLILRGVRMPMMATRPIIRPWAASVAKVILGVASPSPHLASFMARSSPNDLIVVATPGPRRSSWYWHWHMPYLQYAPQSGISARMSSLQA